MDDMEKNNQTLRVTFQVKADEVQSALNKMDKLQGQSKKQTAVFSMIMILAALDFYHFLTTKNGFAFILTLLFLVMGVMYRKKSMVANRRLAEAFEADPEQVVDAQFTQLQLSERTISYNDIVVMYEFRESFGLRYMGNHYFVIPKRVFSEDQLSEFVELMKAQLKEKYDDRSDKM